MDVDVKADPDTKLEDFQLEDNDVDGPIKSYDLAEAAGIADRPALERRLVRKIDFRLSILVLIYITNYIDRAALSAARLKGFEEDLKLTGREFDTLLS